MIRLCSCTGRSSSSLRSFNNTDTSMTCKGCGGESVADRGRPSCSSKLNTMGLELPRPIDPEVRWKNVNKRQRAARRARTSFSGEDRMKDQIRFFYAFGNAASKEMAQDARVSESEKLGVSILGRRFGDTMENAPIKKRRSHMDCSPSPPPTPLLVDPYEKELSSRSFGGISLYGKHRKVKMQGCEPREERKGPFDAADFSGISILADAAIESELGIDILNGECSKSVHSLEEIKLGNITGSSELSVLHEIKEAKLDIYDASDCKSDMPLKLPESAPDMKPATLNSLESAPDDMKSLFPTTLNSSGNLFESAAAANANPALYSALSSANKSDDSSSAFDAKSSGVTMSNNVNNPHKSGGCSEDTVVQTKRDSRLHWDLNVAMEAWDTDCGGDHDLVGSDPIAFVASDRNDAEDEMEKAHACQNLFSSTVPGDIPDLSVDNIHVDDAPNDVATKIVSGFPGDSSSHPLCSRSPQKLQLSKTESLDGKDFSAETKDLSDQRENNCASEVQSHLGFNTDLSSFAPTREQFAFTANVEKLDISHASLLDSEGLSHLTSVDGHDGGNSIQTSELYSRLKPLTSRLVSEESTNVPTLTVFSKNLTDLGSSDDKLGQASLQSISECKNQELLDVDSGTSKTVQPVNDKAEDGADVPCVNKEAVDTHSDFDLPGPHPNNNEGSSDGDVAHVVADATVNCKNRLISCANSSSAETYYNTSDATQALGLDSKCTKQAVTDVDSIVDSQSAAQSCPSHKNVLQKVASNNYLEHCYETDTSHISKDLSMTGKVDAEAKDSQYEDGELRESGDGYWADDGYEVGKQGRYHVSDYKDGQGGRDIHSLPVGSSSQNMGVPVADYNGKLSRKDDGDVSPVSSKRSWSSNCLEGRSGTTFLGTASKKAHSVHLSAKSQTRLYENPGLIAGSAVTGGSQSEKGSDGLGDDPLSIRTKATGWDMVPEDQSHTQHDSSDGVDSANRVLGTLDAAGGGESCRQMGLTNRNVQSRVDRPRSLGRPRRHELCRCDDGYSSDSKVERTTDARRSVGRGGASLHIEASSRGDQWVGNSNHSRSTRRRSPDYYNYGPPAPRNAAEAAVAKMESNGFVVAPDGTLVRAVDASNAGNMTRMMRNTSSSYHPLSGRGSPIDRDGLTRGPAHVGEASPERCFGASSNRSAHEMNKYHITDGNMSSARCSLSSRQRRFPPHRASHNLSRARSRSPSGSRSRSPHAWTSPRKRREIMANGGSSLRRHSRSPNYMTDVRIGRMTSPRWQPGFSDRVMRDNPSSRNHTFSQPDSTWVDGRNCSAVDLSDHKKRYSRRSPPPRITSRNDRFDVMDSQGRPRSGEFCRQSQTQERLPYGFERGNKHDVNGDDKREYANSYEVVKPYDRNGAAKQFRNHAGDKLRGHVYAPRSPEPQRRGSPRRF